MRIDNFLQRHSVKAAVALTALSAVCVVTAWSSLAAASSPMGVYARVDSVTYEPDKNNATSVQINGVFALHQGGSGFNYSEPQPGYMYFTCPSGKELECREQWGNLETFKGGSLCAGFGQMSKSFGTVRPAGSPLSKPDAYDVGIGVQPASHAGGTCPKLLDYKSGGSTGSSGAGGTAPPAGTSTPAPGGGGGDTTNPPSSTPPPAPSSSTNGCAMSSSSSGSNAALFISAALVALAFVGRRRKKTQGS